MPVPDVAAHGAFESPFDYPAPFEMDTARALALGHDFEPVDAWLAEMIRTHAAAQSA